MRRHDRFSCWRVEQTFAFAAKYFDECLIAGLVREIGHDVDPHAGKEWFHANISKDQAYSLLSAGALHKRFADCSWAQF